MNANEECYRRIACFVAGLFAAGFDKGLLLSNRVVMMMSLSIEASVVALTNAKPYVSCVAGLSKGLFVDQRTRQDDDDDDVSLDRDKCSCFNEC